MIRSRSSEERANDFSGREGREGASDVRFAPSPSRNHLCAHRSVPLILVNFKLYSHKFRPFNKIQAIYIQIQTAINETINDKQ